MRAVHSSEFPAGVVDARGWYLYDGTAECVAGGPFHTEEDALSAREHMLDAADDDLFGNYGSLPR